MRPVALALALLVLSACAAVPVVDAPVQNPELERSARVTGTLVPVVRIKGADSAHFDLAARMQHYNTPGVSIAVVDGEKIVWARGFGVTERGKPALVTPTTLFQAASISKAVTATATLRLAEQEKFSLDDDVNKVLTSWKVPDSEFTATEKVTLRRLMSHSAGINLHGFLGYRNGDKLPTVLQILDGKPPANTEAIRVTATPGSGVSYSGGGVLIEQLLLTDVTKKPFPQLMRELVLIPAGMRESTFDVPLSEPAARHAATAHDAGGAPLRGRWVAYPEMAAAGLWSTPSDLLAWAMAIADARAGRPLSVLSPASAKAMLTPQKGPIGLGPIVRGEGRALRFGHSGWADGAHAEVVYFPEIGKGAAVMVNGASGRPLVREILYAIAKEYGWPDFEPDPVEPAVVDGKILDALVGHYGVTVDGAIVDVVLRRDGDKLVFESKKLAVTSEVAFIEGSRFVVLDSGDELRFKLDAEGANDELEWSGIVLAREKR